MIIIGIDFDPEFQQIACVIHVPSLASMPRELLISSRNTLVNKQLHLGPAVLGLPRCILV